jgi:hypothetical protein
MIVFGGEAEIGSNTFWSDGGRSLRDQVDALPAGGCFNLARARAGSRDRALFQFNSCQRQLGFEFDPQQTEVMRLGECPRGEILSAAFTMAWAWSVLP